MLKDLFGSSVDDGTLKQPFVIAEIGVNHEGSIDLAKRMILEAKMGGADAVKFQTYRASHLAVKESPAYWDLTMEPTRSQFDLFSKHDKFWIEEMQLLSNYCSEIGIEFLSTPFDIESADFLNGMMDCFKISSSDITNKPLIQHICKYNKPIVLSTGASELWEIHEAVSWIEEYGNPLALLHCVLNYPTEDHNAHIGMITGLKQNFPKSIIGYSDHTLPKDMKVCELATILGARIIEKHFTFDKNLPGNDHYHAMDINDLKNFRKIIDRNILVIGGCEVTSLPQEEIAKKNARRSLVANSDIKAGELITNQNLTTKRPASGISPRNLDEVVGLRARIDICNDTVLQWHMLD